MNIHNHKKGDKRIPVGDVPCHIAFWEGDELCTCCGTDGEHIIIKYLHNGAVLTLHRDHLVPLEPAAEIHIGPHPAEAKLKKLIAKCKVVFDVLAKQGTPCPAIPTMIKEFEDDE